MYDGSGRETHMVGDSEEPPYASGLAAFGRYQNILGQEHVVCPAGTLLFARHGLWHGGGLNRSERVRYMFQIRLINRIRFWRFLLGDDAFDADYWATRVENEPTQRVA